MVDPNRPNAKAMIKIKEKILFSKDADIKK